MRIVLIITLTLLICGCSYSFQMNAFPHLKTIEITPFENKAEEFELAQEIQDSLVNQFQKDGRLKISTISPDIRIEGSVLDYKNDILSYDIAGNISEYRLQILFSILMTDMVYDDKMYENKSLLVSESYSPNASSEEIERFTTVEQAKGKIYEKVFETLVKNTLESW